MADDDTDPVDPSVQAEAPALTDTVTNETLAPGTISQGEVNVGAEPANVILKPTTLDFTPDDFIAIATALNANYADPTTIHYDIIRDDVAGYHKLVGTKLGP